VKVEGEVLHKGRRQATGQAKLTDLSTEKLFATATTTCMILG
jgi:acyl-coenzyme A thioesterase PaaI-like protein